jgi:hypothetical protein
MAFAFEADRDEIETISEVFDLRDAGRWALRPIFAVEIRPYRTMFCPMLFTENVR